MTLRIIKIILTVHFIGIHGGFEKCYSSDIEVYRDFLFIRHGQTDWGPQDILKGPLDLTLNEEGRKQAQHSYEMAKDNFTITQPLIFSSPLVRAHETAEIFALNFSPCSLIQKFDGLKERYYGDHRKMEIQQIPDDAESEDNFQERVRTTLAEILKISQRDTNSLLIIFSHQKVFEYLTEWLTHQKLKLDQGGVCYFQYDRDNYSVKIY